QELGQQRVTSLARPLKLDDRRADGAQLIEDLEHALLDALEQLRVRQRQPSPKLAGVEVIEDVHDLEQHTGVALLLAGPEPTRGHQRELHEGGGARELVVDVELEDSPEVIDGVAAERVEPLAVAGVV